MTVGQCIKDARKNAGLTQRELAEKAGTATGTIQQYELGKRQPRLEQLRQIALALGTTVSELVEPGYWSTLPQEDLDGMWKEEPTDPQHRISAAIRRLNDAGRRIAADRVEELTEIPRYRAET